MIKNYYWAMAVIAAFVAGTIATATPVFAPPPGDDDDGEGGWKLAVAGLQEQIDTLGTESCEDITGSADLCDGVDDVGDGGTGPVLGFYLVEHIVELDGGSTVALVSGASCDLEDIAISGSYEYVITDPDGPSQLAQIQRTIQSESNTWSTTLSWDQGAGDGSSITFGTICADFEPEHNNAD